MASDLGVSAMYISEIENGKRTPLRGDVLPRIAIYLGLDPAMVTDMAFSERAEAKKGDINSELSLMVARKTMDVKDTDILHKILSMLQDEE
jgi:transcriptional regulator with XRE-family HTH domain